jgi:hypothetical protein
MLLLVIEPMRLRQKEVNEVGGTSRCYLDPPSST